MNRRFSSVLLSVLVLVTTMANATEPLVSEKYHIHDGEHIIYLGMEIAEVEKMLGPPVEISKVRLEDPLHNFDIVTWEYPSLYISFNDISSRSVVQICIPDKETSFKLGNTIIPQKTTREEIEAIYGKPEYIFPSEKCEYIYCQYDVEPLKKPSPYAFTLYLRFNHTSICDEIVFRLEW